MEAIYMRKKAVQALLGALLLAGAIGVAQQRKQQEIDLQAAIRKETVDGDLNGAIKQYAAIVSKYKSDRTTAAMALVRMADCYRKMDDAESRKLYERVVKEYGDQKEAVVLARAGLGGGTQTRRQTNTLIWSGPNTYIDGTVSLDGRYFSYVDWDTGDLALRELATGAVRRLTQTGNTPGTANGWKDYAEDTAISRDGKQLAFSWWNEAAKGYELRVVNVAGEPNPRRLWSNPEFDWVSPRDWSPDGKWIAVLLSRPDRTAALGMVSAADGSLRVLPTGRLSDGSGVFFSPDGRHIGYDLPESNIAQPRDLFIFDIQAGREIPIAVRRGQDVMMGWTPDGKRLLFGSDRSSSVGLWAQTLDNGRLLGPPELLKPDLGTVEPLGVTQSGILYYAVVPGPSPSRLQVASIDFATGRIASPRDVSENYLESNTTPVWSPDGRLFAHFSRRGSGYRVATVIAIRSAETYGLIREIPVRHITLDGWAPDGQSLLGVGPIDNRRGALRIDAQTAAVTPIAVDPENSPGRMFRAAWSPDGKSLYYSRSFREGAEFAFFKRDLSSGDEKELVRRPFLGALNLSPDGRFLVTPTVDPSTNSGMLLLIPTDSGQTREVARYPAEVAPADLKNFSRGQRISSPIWTSDSKSFLFRRRRATDDEVHEQWLFSLEGDALRQVDAPVESNRFLWGVHPDGKRILLTTIAPGAPRQTQVWALENFLPASK
jgi:Tol biopolymer transport system component